MWISRKYTDSCCLDEAIDWCNHGEKSLDNINEIAEYVQWREELKQVCSKLSKLLERRYYQELSEIF